MTRVNSISQSILLDVSILKMNTLNNNHSYNDKITLIKDGLKIETIIGGEISGLIVWTLIYPEDKWEDKIIIHLKKVIIDYNRIQKNIPQNI